MGPNQLGPAQPRMEHPQQGVQPHPNSSLSMAKTLSIPLIEFIERLQKLHAQQGNHPGTQLQIRDSYGPGPGPLYIDNSSSVPQAGGTIVAICFK